MKGTVKKIITLLIIFMLILPFMHELRVEAASIGILGLIKNLQEESEVSTSNDIALGASVTQTINGITYVLDTTNKTATVTKVVANTSDKNVMGVESYKVYLNIPQRVNVNGVAYIVDKIGDGTNNVLTTSVSSGTSFAQFAGGVTGDIYIVLPKSIREVKANAFSNCYGANDNTAIMVDSNRNVVLICLSNNVNFATNSKSDQTAVLGVKGSGAEKLTPRFRELFTYTTSGNTATVTGCNTWGTDKIFDKLGTSVRFNLEIPQYVIDASGNKYTVTGVGQNAFSSEKRLQHVVIPATTRTIGNRAFANCSNLIWAKILSNTVTISSTAFQYDDSLEYMYGLQGSTTYNYAGSKYRQLSVTKLTVKNKPTKTSYEIGDAFDPSGLVLSAEFTDVDGWVNTSDIIYGNYSDEYPSTSYKGIMLSGPTMSTSGTKTVTAYYGNNSSVSTTFTITVKNIYQEVTLNANGGTGGTSKIKACSNGQISVYNDGSWQYELLTTENDSTGTHKIMLPERDGYTFAGYYYNSTQIINRTGHLSNTTHNGEFLITNNVTTLTAKWTQNIVYQEVTLNADGGTGGTSKIKACSNGQISVYNDGSWQYELLTTENDSTGTHKVTPPSKSGYKFLGYYYNNTQIIDDTGHLSSTTFNGGFLIFYNVTTLTAKWEEESSSDIPVTSVGIASEAEVEVEKTILLEVGVYPTNATNKKVTYKSSDETIATVEASSEGVIVKGIKEGTATITVTSEDGGKIATCTVTVKAKAYTINLDNQGATTAGTTKVYVKPGDGVYSDSACTNKISKITPPKKTGYKFKGYYDNATNGEKYDLIDENGNFINDNSIYSIYNIARDCSLYAKWEEGSVSVTGVTLDKTTMEVEVNEIKTLKSTVTPENATNKNVTYSSSDKTIAIVDEYGNVTGIKAGTATITVTTEDGNKTATCTVTVKASNIAVTGIELDKTAAEINIDKTITLTATIKPNNATNKNVTWKSSDETIATVDANGIVTGIKEGTATITATTEDGNKTATCAVTVKDGAVKPIIKKVDAESSKGQYIVYVTLEDNGAEISKVEFDANDITANKTSDGRYYFLPEKNKTYTIKVTDKNGNIVTKDYTVTNLLEKSKAEPSKDSKGNYIVEITPQTNHEVDKVTVNGEDITKNVTEDGKYWFIVTKDGEYKIKVTYKDGTAAEEITYKETRFTENKNQNGSSNSTNGTIPGKTTNSDNLSNTILPKTGYQIGLLVGITTLIGLSIVFYKKSKM